MTAYITSTGHTASHWAGQQGDAPPSSVTEVMAKYRSWCAEGNPLFTKAETRRVRDLLDQRPGRGQMIPIQGIDGATVNFEIRTGDIWPGDNDAEELLLQNPHIVFRMPSKIEEVLTSDDPDFLEAYCTIQIKHDLVRRSKYTKQILDEYDLPEQDDMIKYLFDIMADWQNSVTQECLKGILSQCRIPQQISKLLGFACGSICNITGYDERQAYQNAFLLALKTELDGLEDQQGPSTCYAQDPDYTDRDKATLQTFGIRVLDSPNALLEIDESSLVYACCAGFPIKQITRDFGRPAMLVWDRVRRTEEKKPKTNPDTTQVIQMIRESYHTYQFPHGSNHLSDLVIYVRRINASIHA